jgi:penicillin amidase
LGAAAASNSWAIAPARSASGGAIHASDPHLSIDRAPGLWYLASVHTTDGLGVVGVTQPGLPFVVMGHNGAISFAFTVAAVDVIDYYDEELTGGPAPKARGPEGFEAVEAREETVVVRGESIPRRVSVYETRRGPLVERTGTRGVSLHWAGFDRSLPRLIDSALALGRATTFGEFRRAVTSFGALDANWVYSDRAGNIGYQLGAPIPIRAGDGGFERRKGSDPTSAWTGYVDLERTPHALNPSEGWIASCNNQPVGSEWPYPIPGFYDPYRITRAAELLSRDGAWDARKAAAMQLDLVSGRALRWRELAAAGAAGAGDAELARRLRAWSGEMGVGSREAAVYALWWHEMARALFEDDLGDDWRDGRSVQEQVLSRDIGAIVDDLGTPQQETADAISARAMARAIALADGRTLGEMSTLTVAHPLARVAILNRWLALSRGPVEAGGDLGSLNANFSAFDEEAAVFESRMGASMRFVLDWADVDGFSIALAFGQSGNPLSRHYDDFFAPSLRGEGWVVPYSKERAEARMVGRLKLVPAAERGATRARG